MEILLVFLWAGFIFWLATSSQDQKQVFLVVLWATMLGAPTLYYLAKLFF